MHAGPYKVHRKHDGMLSDPCERASKHVDMNRIVSPQTFVIYLGFHRLLNGHVRCDVDLSCIVLLIHTDEKSGVGRGVRHNRASL